MNGSDLAPAHSFGIEPILSQTPLPASHSNSPDSEPTLSHCLTDRVTVMLALRCRCACASSRPVRPRRSGLRFSTSSSLSPPSSPRPWRGLDTWRRAPPSELRHWGPSGPVPYDLPVRETDAIESASSLAELGAAVLSTADPLAKSQLSHLAFSKWRRLMLPVGHAVAPDHPSRPDKPVLVFSSPFLCHLLANLLLSSQNLCRLIAV